MSIKRTNAKIIKASEGVASGYSKDPRGVREKSQIRFRSAVLLFDAGVIRDLSIRSAIKMASTSTLVHVTGFMS